MRTTVTLDPDVEVLLRHAMREHGEPFKQVLNNAVREALLHGRTKPRRGQSAPKLPVFHMGLPSLDLEHANRVAEQLEDEQLLARLRRGR